MAEEKAVYELLDQALKKSSLFALLSSQQRKRIIQQFKCSRYAPGDVIVQQEDQADAFFIIQEGDVQVYKSVYGTVDVVATLSNGNSFGELGLLHDSKRSATVKAMTPVTVWYLSRDDLGSELNQIRDERIDNAFKNLQTVWSLLSTQMLFSSVDEENSKAALLQAFFPLTFEEGEVILKKGEQGDNFYVIEEGAVDIIVKDGTTSNKIAVTLHQGESFGELSILGNSPIAATVVAKNRVKLWACDRATFYNNFHKGARTLRKQFETYSRHVMLSNGSIVAKESTEYTQLDDVRKNAEPVLIWQDFVTSLHDDSFAFHIQESTNSQQLLPSRLRRVLRRLFVASQVKSSQNFDRIGSSNSPQGALKFPEYALMCLLLSKPNSEFEIAFRIFDKDHNGSLSKQEFITAMSALATEMEVELIEEEYGQDDSQSTSRRLINRLLGRPKSRIQSFSSAESHQNLLLFNVEQMQKSLSGLLDQWFDKDGLRELSLYEFRTLLASSLDNPSQVPLPIALRSLVEDARSLAAESWVHNTTQMALSDETLIVPETKNWTSESRHSKGTTYAKDKKQESRSIFDAWRSLLAGALAGAVSRSFVSPLERLKMLFQTQGIPPTYTGVTQGLKLIYRQDGFLGYYKGNGSNIIRIAPATAFQFYFFDTYKSILVNANLFGRDDSGMELRQLHIGEKLLAGGFAGCTASMLTYPLDLMRARLTVQSGETKKYKGVVHGIVTIARTEGPTALFKGLWPTLLGVFPYIGIDFAAYETLKSYAPKTENNALPAPHVLLFCGAAAGCIAQTVAYPLDLVRRKVQVQDFLAEMRKGHENATVYQYKGVWDALTTISRTEGVRGLYKGLFTNYLKVGPAVGITFLAYEHLKQWLNVESGSH